MNSIFLSIIYSHSNKNFKFSKYVLVISTTSTPISYDLVNNLNRNSKSNSLQFNLFTIQFLLIQLWVSKHAKVVLKQKKQNKNTLKVNVSSFTKILDKSTNKK